MTGKKSSEPAAPPSARCAPTRGATARASSQAARELFASESPDVQIDDVARRAGVGVGTVYRHFPDKEALMGELVRARFEHLQRAAARGARRASSAEAFEVLADALRDNAGSVAEDAATRFAFMSGGERVFAHADGEMDEFMRAQRAVLVARAQARRDSCAASSTRRTCRW